MKALDGYYVVLRGNDADNESTKRRPYMEALSPQTKLFTCKWRNTSGKF